MFLLCCFLSVVNLVKIRLGIYHAVEKVAKNVLSVLSVRIVYKDILIAKIYHYLFVFLQIGRQSGDFFRFCMKI